MQNLNETLEMIGAIVVLIKADQTVGYINTAGCRSLGYNEKEIIGKNWFDSFIPKNNRKKVKNYFLNCINKKINKDDNFENEIITSEGIKIILWSNTIIKNDDGEVESIISSGEDVTYLRRLEKKLIENQNKLREAQRIAKLGHWELDILKNNLTWTDGIYEVFEVDKSAFNATFESFIEFVHPEDRLYVKDAYLNSLKNKTPYEITHRLLMKDGRVKFVNEVCRTEYNSQGEAIYSFGIVQDITTQFIKDREYTELLETNATLLDSLKDMVVLVDLDGNIISKNKSWDEFRSKSNDQVVNLTNENYIKIFESAFSLTPEDVSKVHKGLISVLKQRVKSFSLIFKSGSEKTRWFDILVKPVGLKARGAVVIHTDITDYKNQEKTLLEEQELHRDIIVRELHHRIKNNLQGVTGILNNFRINNPELHSPIIDAISKVNSIAIIYGLLGRSSGTEVRLCDLTIAIARDNESLWEKLASINIPNKWAPVRVSQSEAVPIALIVNELISNAMKHSKINQQIFIMLRRETNTDSVILSISNFGLLPIGFQFPMNQGYGSGLDIIYSLLPKNGAQLFFEQLGEKVIASFILRSPIINSES